MMGEDCVGVEMRVSSDVEMDGNFEEGWNSNWELNEGL
jgi:hypothetical protein